VCLRPRILRSSVFTPLRMGGILELWDILFTLVPESDEADFVFFGTKLHDLYAAHTQATLAYSYQKGLEDGAAIERRAAAPWQDSTHGSSVN